MAKYSTFLISQILLLTGHLSAAIFYEIDTTRPLKCIFSGEHHNRIMIDKGRVMKIIYPQDVISIRLEEHSGQAFINSINQAKKFITVAVVTESGLVQDLEIEFIERPAETVILTEPEEPIKEEIQQAEIALPPQTEANLINSKIQEILLGVVPNGYVSYPMERKKRKIKRNIQAETIIRLEGDNDTLYIYEIANLCRKKNTLTEADLRCPGNLWIFLEDHQINSKGKILGIVCVSKS